MFNRRIQALLCRVYDRFIRLKGEPRQIALGFSLGLLVGMTPFLGAHLLLAVMVASLLGWSKIAAVAGANITNVFTVSLIYPLNYWVGVKLVGVSKGVDWSRVGDSAEMLALMKQSPLILVDLLVGGWVLGIPLAVAGYFAVLRLVRPSRKPSPLGPCDHCAR